MEFATGSDSEEGSEEQDMVAPMKDLGISAPKRKNAAEVMGLKLRMGCGRTWHMRRARPHGGAAITM